MSNQEPSIRKAAGKQGEPRQKRRLLGVRNKPIYESRIVKLACTGRPTTTRSIKGVANALWGEQRKAKDICLASKL